MADVYGIFDQQDIGEAFFAQMFRSIVADGVVAGPGDPDGMVSANGSGMTSFVAPFPTGLWIDGYFRYTTTQATINHAAPNATNPRFDLVIVRVDPVANTIITTVKAGTPAATPSLPALTQTPTGVYEIALASVLIDAAPTATNIPAGKVSDRRTFSSRGIGAVLSAAVSTAAFRRGSTRYNEAYKGLEFWNAAAWEAVPKLGQIDAGAVNGKGFRDGVAVVASVPAGGAVTSGVITDGLNIVGGGTLSLSVEGDGRYQPAIVNLTPTTFRIAVFNGTGSTATVNVHWTRRG